MIEWMHSLAGALTELIIGLTGVGGNALMAPILLFKSGIVVVMFLAGLKLVL